MSSRGFQVEAVRRDFPILHQRVHGKPLIWPDNAATTQKPRRVIEALTRFYEHDNSNIHRGAHTLAARATDLYEGACEKVRRFLGAAQPEEIIFVHGATEAINLVAQSYGRQFLQPGDEIVLSRIEHHANIVPWQQVARDKGAVLRVIRKDCPRSPRTWSRPTRSAAASTTWGTSRCPVARRSRFTRTPASGRARARGRS